MLCREIQRRMPWYMLRQLRLGRFVGFDNNNQAVGCLGSQGKVNHLLALRVLVQVGQALRLTQNRKLLKRATVKIYRACILAAEAVLGRDVPDREILRQAHAEFVSTRAGS